MRNKRDSIKLSKITIFVCILSVLFAFATIFTAYEMRENSKSVYEHPYTVSNNARAMRSRLLDMKRFVSSLLVDDYVSDGRVRELFDERYAIQNEAINTLDERYLGPQEDIDALRDAFNLLIDAQESALEYVEGHTSEEIDKYIEDNVYPYYDGVDRALETIIDYADSQIASLTSQASFASSLFIILAVFLTVVIVALSVYSSKSERKSIAVLEKRELELEDALLVAQQAGNAKRDFLSRMSHEIRTPMNVIIGMTTIAGAHIDDKSRMEDCLSKISYSSRHLLSIINDVLDMSKIEEGKLLISQKPFELRQLIESVMAIIYSQTKEQNKTFECEIMGEVYETYVGDFMRVNQILLNILSNAVKFTPEGGEIRMTVEQVSVKEERAHLRFVISDTGIGMSEEFLEHIFQPFEQADSSISEKYGGTGLGMAITYNLVELLGGSIHVASKQGEGSTFTVELPFGVPSELVAPKKWALETLSVLVVDDDADACIHAEFLLEQMGIKAEWVQSGVKAVEMIFHAHDSDNDYDVCLVDWKMPDMDGIEVTRRIRAKLGPDTIIIIISAYDWSVIEEEAREAGANAFISKPLFESSLYNVLQSVCGVPAPGKQVKESHDGNYIGKRFLLVEDNELNREIAVDLLSETGAVIECAENGEQAVDVFLSSPKDYFDAVLMDIQMPVMNGYEATKLIRDSDHPNSKTVPIFAMTANAFREDIERSLNSGMNGHISKPIDLKTLFEALDGV